MEYRVRVREVMNNTPKTCAPEISVFEAVRVMNSTFGGFLPVVNGDGRLVGVLSRGDVLKKSVAEKHNLDEIKVSDIMQSVEGAVMIDADAEVTEAMRIMGKRNKKSLPVCDGEKFVGIFSIQEILEFMPSLMEILIENLHINDFVRKQRKDVFNP